MKLGQTVQEVISLAKALNQARSSEGSGDDSPIVASGGAVATLRPGTAAHEQRLRQFLEAQPPSVVYMLTAIMYLGRGDFAAKELRARYTEISETFGGTEWAARQMLEKWLLPEYLEEGLKKLVRAGMDVDHLLAA